VEVRPGFRGIGLITAEEFERQYAERSGITVERLREMGRIVAPCNCGEDMCEGWQSTTQERLDDERKWREFWDDEG
jgi:hypothetical protein